MRVVFLGTPSFAVPTLDLLAASGHDVCAVVTQPDRPKGRGNPVAESPVKIAATLLGIPVYQPERIRRPESVRLLESFEAEVMVVVGYGQIIPQVIIDLPKYGILNVHASLLPKYRGAAPIQWAIANGETETGVTIMQIDAGLDTGDMLRKAAIPIDANETSSDLGLRLAALGAELLLETVQQIENGSAAPEKQNNAEATVAPILKKEDALVDWSQEGRRIYNRFRGFQPWPGSYTYFRGQQLTMLRLMPSAEPSGEPGTMSFDKRRLLVACGGETSLEVFELQLAGKKRMTAEAFLNGYRPAHREKLGEQS
jgi:methionyl-tRNA formyltransferase